MTDAEQGRVVVAWTPDRYGEVALAHGLTEARDHDRGVVVVNGTRGDALVDDRYAGTDAVARLRDRLGACGLDAELRQTVGANVADQVLDVAAEVGACLIVLGLRRRSAVGKLIMGSVAQRVILGAGCPVLCVKPGDPG